jgi:hypothetical protein
MSLTCKNYSLGTTANAGLGSLTVGIIYTNCETNSIPPGAIATLIETPVSEEDRTRLQGVSEIAGQNAYFTEICSRTQPVIPNDPYGIAVTEIGTCTEPPVTVTPTPTPTPLPNRCIVSTDCGNNGIDPIDNRSYICGSPFESVALATGLQVYGTCTKLYNALYVANPAAAVTPAAYRTWFDTLPLTNKLKAITGTEFTSPLTNPTPSAGYRFVNWTPTRGTTNNNDVTFTANYELIPPPAVVTIARTSAAVTVAQGSTTSNTINITRTNYTGTVSLALVNLPAGVTATITPNPTTANAFSIVLTALATATVGDPVTVTCTATYDVDKTATTSFELTVTASSNPTLSLSATNVTMRKSTTAASTVTAVTTGINSPDRSVTVGIDSRDIPANTNIVIDNPIIETAAIRITTTAASPVGTYTIRLTGTTTTGAVPANTSFQLIIQADETRIVTYAKTPLAAGYTLPFDRTVNVNTRITLPTPVSATGYTFDGWFVGDQLRSGEQTITTNTTFTARFTATNVTPTPTPTATPVDLPVTFSPSLTPLVFTYQRGTTVYPLPVQITATNNSSRQHTVKLDTNQQFNFIKNGITTTGTLTFIVPPNSSQAFAIVPLQGLFTVGGLLDGDTQFPITVTDS